MRAIGFARDGYDEESDRCARRQLLRRAPWRRAVGTRAARDSRSRHLSARGRLSRWRAAGGGRAGDVYALQCAHRVQPAGAISIRPEDLYAVRPDSAAADGGSLTCVRRLTGRSRCALETCSGQRTEVCQPSLSFAQTSTCALAHRMATARLRCDQVLITDTRTFAPATVRSWWIPS